MKSLISPQLHRYLTFTILITLSTSCSKKNNLSPILLLATQNEFGLYTGEILKTEGFNVFETDSITNPGITLGRLQGFDIIILAQTSITSAQQQLLASYVEEGGNLISFRPDKKLSNVFGLIDKGGETVEGYLSINDNNEIGKALTTEALQIHGIADEYTLDNGLEVARLFVNDSIATESPAVVINTFGKGKALAFLYNLPKSIVYTRQGNPLDAGKEMDGITGIRAMDLFTNGFVNSSKNTLNQADEQMRLLSHSIEHLSLRSKPIPRFWYFPDTLKCIVTLNNDGEDSKEMEFVQQFEDVFEKGARMTLYIKEVEYISPEWVGSWAGKGFEMSGHPDNTRQAESPDWHTMDSVYQTLLKELQANYGIESMRTVNNHLFVWVGNNENGERNFAAQARIEEKHGVELDCNYAHYDNGSNQRHFLGEMGIRQGNYTGSGLAMKFADASGSVINVYQQLNNVYDQQYMEHKDQDGYYEAFKGLMDRSLSNEVYSTISIRAHNNEYFFSKEPLMRILDYSKSRGIPVWTEVQFLDFLKTKDEARIGDLQWSANTLNFTIHSSLTHQNGITCMLPNRYNGKFITGVISNGLAKSYSIKSIKGQDYAWLTIKPGANYNIEVRYGDQ